MTNIWSWIASHWSAWAVSGGFGFVGGLVAGTFRWFYPSRKEWLESRKSRKDAKADELVLQAISDQKLWTGPRPMTGGGMFGVQAQEIAEHLKLNVDTVADALERLEIHGCVGRGKGGLSPLWFYKPR